MRTITLPYSGELLLSHLMGYGLLLVLDDQGTRAFLSHDDGLTFSPAIHVDDDVTDDVIAAAVRDSADRLEPIVEADLAPGLTGNNRRPVIWARRSYANAPEAAVDATAKREALTTAAGASDDRLALGLLAGLGAPATWGGDDLKPQWGATALDGVLGNHTSDFVRGVLRPGRASAAQLVSDRLWAVEADITRREPQHDKTGWAPPNTPAALAHQWLAALGLAVLPVAHRRHARSATPATWARSHPRVLGAVVPVLQQPTSCARVCAIVGLQALSESAVDDEDSAERARAVSTLEALGVAEVATFRRQNARGSGSSVAFSFEKGTLIRLCRTSR